MDRQGPRGRHEREWVALAGTRGAATNARERAPASLLWLPIRTDETTRLDHPTARTTSRWFIASSLDLTPLSRDALQEKDAMKWSHAEIVRLFSGMTLCDGVVVTTVAELAECRTKL